jgi:hypothetical protein
MVERGSTPVACLEQDPDENDCCIHENDADRRNYHRSAGLYRGAFDLESGPRAFGCGEADHGCNPRFREFEAILVLAVICFIAGLIVPTRAGLRAKNPIERRVPQRLPGYTLVRGLAGRVTGQADEPSFAPALAEIEEALVPARIVERLEDGSYTVLVPSVPTPMAGAIYILPPERVHPVDVPFSVALNVFSKWGTGAGEFVRAMQAAKSSQAAS